MSIKVLILTVFALFAVANCVDYGSPEFSARFSVYAPGYYSQEGQITYNRAAKMIEISYDQSSQYYIVGDSSVSDVCEANNFEVTSDGLSCIQDSEPSVANFPILDIPSEMNSLWNDIGNVNVDFSTGTMTCRCFDLEGEIINEGEISQLCFHQGNQNRNLCRITWADINGSEQDGKVWTISEPGQMTSRNGDTIPAIMMPPVCTPPAKKTDLGLNKRTNAKRLGLTSWNIAGPQEYQMLVLSVDTGDLPTVGALNTAGFTFGAVLENPINAGMEVPLISAVVQPKFSVCSVDPDASMPAIAGPYRLVDDPEIFGALRRTITSLEIEEYFSSVRVNLPMGVSINIEGSNNDFVNGDILVLPRGYTFTYTTTAGGITSGPSMPITIPDSPNFELDGNTQVSWIVLQDFGTLPGSVLRFTSNMGTIDTTMSKKRDHVTSMSFYLPRGTYFTYEACVESETHTVGSPDYVCSQVSYSMTTSEPVHVISALNHSPLLFTIIELRNVLEPIGLKKKSAKDIVIENPGYNMPMLTVGNEQNINIINLMSPEGEPLANFLGLNIGMKRNEVNQFTGRYAIVAPMFVEPIDMFAQVMEVVERVEDLKKKNAHPGFIKGPSFGVAIDTDRLEQRRINMRQYFTQVTFMLPMTTGINIMDLDETITTETVAYMPANAVVRYCLTSSNGFQTGPVRQMTLSSTMTFVFDVTSEFVMFNLMELENIFGMNGFFRLGSDGLFGTANTLLNPSAGAIPPVFGIAGLADTNDALVQNIGQIFACASSSIVDDTNNEVCESVNSAIVSIFRTGMQQIDALDRFSQVTVDIEDFEDPTTPNPINSVQFVSGNFMKCASNTETALLLKGIEYDVKTFTDTTCGTASGDADTKFTTNQNSASTNFMVMNHNN